MLQLRQQLDPELIRIATRLGSGDKSLSSLADQLKSGQLEEALFQQLIRSKERFKDNPGALQSIQKLVDGITSSVRSQVSQVTQPTPQQAPTSAESWMRLEAPIFALHCNTIISQARQVTNYEQAVRSVQQLEFVLQIAYRRWNQQNVPPVIQAAVQQMEPLKAQLQQRIAVHQSSIQASRVAMVPPVVAAQATRIDRSPSPQPLDRSDMAPRRPSPSPDQSSASGDAIPLSELPPMWQQKLQQMLEHQPQQFIDQFLAPAFAGKFDQMKYLSRGGMGIVIKARQKLGDEESRSVAIKLNLLVNDQDMLRSFMNEGGRAAKLGFHPNVVSVIETNQVSVPLGGMRIAIPYHALEFVEQAQEGTFFTEKMKEAGEPLPVEAALLLIDHIATGLLAAHEKGIVHRDVKPQNVLIPAAIQEIINNWAEDPEHLPQPLIRALAGLPKEQEIKVSDFGLAGVRNQQLKSIEADDEQQVVTGHHTLTQKGGFIGSPYYISPEAFNDATTAGKPWDVYSLGLILYSLLTGSVEPLKYSKNVELGKISPHGIRVRIVGDKSVRPAVAGPQKDPNIKELLQRDSRNKEVFAMLQRMTSYEPEDRPTLKEFKEWIQKELERRSANTVRMKRLVTAFATIVPALLVGIGLYIANLRPEEHVAFGARRKASVAEVTSALDDQNITSEQLRGYVEKLKALEIPEGYAAEGDEPTGVAVQSLVERSERRFQELEQAEKARLEAEQLIVEGDRLLNPVLPNGERDPNAVPDFEGARRKYREAEVKSSGVESVVRGKLEEVDRIECQFLYVRARDSYHRISLHKDVPTIERLTRESQRNFDLLMNFIFLNSSAEVRNRSVTHFRSFSGLPLSQRQNQHPFSSEQDPLATISRRQFVSLEELVALFQMQSVLRNWVERISNIHTLADSIAQYAPDDFKRQISQFANAISRKSTLTVEMDNGRFQLAPPDIVTLLSYIKSVIITLKNRELDRLHTLHPDLTPDAIVARANQAPLPTDFVELRRIMDVHPFITNQLYQIFRDTNTIFPNPGTVESAQLHAKSRMEVFLESILGDFADPEFPSAYSKAVTFFENAYFLFRQIQARGSFAEYDSRYNSPTDWLNEMVRQCLSAVRFKLNTQERSRLRAWIEANCPEYSFLISETQRILHLGS